MKDCYFESTRAECILHHSNVKSGLIEAMGCVRAVGSGNVMSALRVRKSNFRIIQSNDGSLIDHDALNCIMSVIINC